MSPGCPHTHTHISSEGAVAVLAGSCPDRTHPLTSDAFSPFSSSSFRVRLRPQQLGQLLPWPLLLHQGLTPTRRYSGRRSIRGSDRLKLWLDELSVCPPNAWAKHVPPWLVRSPDMHHRRALHFQPPSLEAMVSTLLAMACNLIAMASNSEWIALLSSRGP